MSLGHHLTALIQARLSPCLGTEPESDMHFHFHHKDKEVESQGQTLYQESEDQLPPEEGEQVEVEEGAPQQKKALLIGINYTGTENELKGCHDDVHNMSRFLASKGYPINKKSMKILTDDREDESNPTGANMLAAMDWLVSEPNTTCFLLYSGHGGQVEDPDGDRDSGFDDTIVPLDFEENGQLDSDILHRHLVSALHPSSSLFVIFDCCHSGSAIELPFMYRSDEQGNVSLVDSMKEGVHLVAAAQHLLKGGFSKAKVQEAKELLAGAQSLFHNMKHRHDTQEEGLGEETFQEEWNTENKNVFMYSGCKDDQTSADATEDGQHVGAMSWAFLKTMEDNPEQTYLEVCR